MFLQIFSCCPFLTRFRRKASKHCEESDLQNRLSQQNTTALVSGKDELRTVGSASLKQTNSFSKPGSPTSSDGEYYDCHSEFSNNLVTSQNLEGLMTEPCIHEEEESTHSLQNFPLWNWMGWGRSSSKKSEDGKRRKEMSTGVVGNETTSTNALNQQEDPSLASCSTIDFGNRSRVLAACMNLISHPAHGSIAGPTSVDEKFIAGSTFTRRKSSVSIEEAKECWEPADPTAYRIRSKTYLKSRIKEPCLGSFYEVIGSDLYSFDKKQTHVAQFVRLPSDPYERSVEELEAIEEMELPTLIVVNMQLPAHQPTLFGSDGLGHSFVFYCVLREHFNPRTFPNQAALGLFRRFVLNPENQSQRRIKLIPKFLNVDEWAETGPLSQTEHHLVKRFNEKPVLTRQYNRFFKGPGYFEIDIDVHHWLYIAKKALWSLLLRTHGVITEVALLIQGNHQDDLPEYIVACARVYRVDLAQYRYLTDYKLKLQSHSTR